MAYTGGLRARLIHDNLFNVVKLGLAEIGWFNTGRQHRPVTLLAKDILPYIGNLQEISPNTIGMTVTYVSEAAAEMGSNLANHSWQYFVDVLGESETLALNLVTDIRDIISGHTNAVTYYGPTFDIYDLTMATPPKIFYVDIQRVIMQKNPAFKRPDDCHLWHLQWEATDTYGDESLQ